MRPRLITALLLAATWLPVHAVAQDPDAITCWWRTSLSAVHVGQSFDVVLTCAVPESDTAIVVPDETRLDPAVVQMAPFEILGGRHAPDLRAEGRRFFQYEYTLRLIADDAFGQDVALPRLELPYRTDARVNGESVPGRGRTYLLPEHSIKVTSLVPANAGDIRDADERRFADVGARTFRADVLAAVAAVALALAAAIAIATLVQFLRRSGARATTTPRLVSDHRILRAVGRELSDVRTTRLATGWTDALAARATAAVRIAAAYALGQDVSQTAASNGAPARAGQIVVRGGLARTREVVVSAPTTTASVAQMLNGHASLNGGRQRFDDLHHALAQLTTAQYAPPHAIDEDALDESLSASARLVRRLAVEHLWVARRLAAWRTSWRT